MLFCAECRKKAKSVIKKRFSWLCQWISVMVAHGCVWVCITKSIRRLSDRGRRSTREISHTFSTKCMCISMWAFGIYSNHPKWKSDAIHPIILYANTHAFINPIHRESLHMIWLAMHTSSYVDADFEYDCVWQTLTT